MADARAHDNDQTESHEPLIARENDGLREEHGVSQTDRQIEEGSKGTGRSLWLLTLSAGISGLLFGYE